VFIIGQSRKKTGVRRLETGDWRCQNQDFQDLKIYKIIIRCTVDDEITYKIIGCAMNVHNTIGNGFQEVIYQRCLAIEMTEKKLNFVREIEMPIYYRSNEVGTRRVDFLVEDKILVELKAILKLEDVHLAQGLNYLTAYNLELGLLINFGSKSLEVKRLYRKNNKVTNHDNPKIL
jgi:GxxExxY protein